MLQKNAFGQKNFWISFTGSGKSTKRGFSLMSNDETKFQPIFQILHIKSAWFLLELALALVTTIGMRFLQVWKDTYFWIIHFETVQPLRLDGSVMSWIIHWFLMHLGSFWIKCIRRIFPPLPALSSGMWLMFINDRAVGARGPRGHDPHNLTDQLPHLNQGEGIMPTTLLLAPPDFQTFLRPCH